MPYALFHDYFPEIAEKETRTVIVLQKSQHGLPPAHYSLLEMYCDEPGCDCRRVMLYVVSSRTGGAVAIVCYGWENRDFYAKWLHDDDPMLIQDLMGPALNVGSPQSELAPAILKMIRDIVLPDQSYVERVKRHYVSFRKKVDGKRLARGKAVKRRKRSGRARNKTK